MKKYLRAFKTQAEYLAFSASTEFILDNVSSCREGDLVYFNSEQCGGYVPPTPPPPPSVYDITAKFNVTDTSNPTQIGYDEYTSGFSKIEVDGVELPSVVSAYTFSTTGEHTVKYSLADSSNIGEAAFYECRSLTSITIPDSVTTIGDYAFTRCTGMTSCTIGSGVTSIGSDSFANCRSLTSITIPDSVTSIGDGAFYDCKSLTSIDIPNSVTSIGSRTFDSCSNLASITVDSNNTIYDSRNNCNAIIETNTNKLIQGCKNAIIPNDVTSIGDWAFWDCYSLTSVTIPNSVITIGNSAFMHCSGLTSITIGNGVTTIGNRAFDRCVSATTVTIGSGVTSIGDNAFYECRSLTSITIPDSVTSIGNYAFQDCTGLTTCTIGSGVTSIGSYAFESCRSLSSITLNAIVPPTLSNINAFSDTNNCPIYVPCDSVDVYKAATNWSSYASRIQAIPGSCWDITAKFNVTDTTSPTRIASVTTYFSAIEIDGVMQPSVGTGYTFSTTGEHTVKYYLKDTSIGGNAFYNCTSLTSIDIPSGVTTIESYAFDNCYNLTSIDIPDSVTSIGIYTFYNCRSLTSVTIPDGVTSIGINTFYSCRSLTSVTIPDGVTSIGGNAFYNCTSLTSITSNATTAPTIQSYTFREVKTGGTLTVPIGSSGYDVWMGTGTYYLGLYNWTKVEQ